MPDKEKIKLLREYIEYYATCPCCQKVDVCLSDCTFQVDAVDDHEIMIHARAILELTKE